MRDLDEVGELCFHCAQCFNLCPYTLPHEWDVDFPGLMRRHQLTRVARDGVPLRRRLTTRTDPIGRIGSRLPALVNFANRNRLSRWLMEKTLGIHRDWVQPTYHAHTTSRWFASRQARGSGENGLAVLFTTCSVEYSDPETGRAAVEVLERSGVRVELCYERCCGMPFTDVGDLESARRHAERNVADLLPFVARGAKVVVPGPSCSLMLKRELRRLVPGAEASRVAEATRDLMEYVYELARQRKLDRGFVNPPGRVAYHAPCHLRAQNVGTRAVDLLRLAGAEVTLVDACSGVDGTWGMQARFHERSLSVARPMLARVEASGAEHIATDCPLSALRIREALGREALHPIVLLRRAYADGAP
jgi:Fe-S oxidoreductase